MVVWYSTVWIRYKVFTHPPVDGHLGIRLFVDICFSLADWVTARSGISGS